MIYVEILLGLAVKGPSGKDRLRMREHILWMWMDTLILVVVAHTSKDANPGVTDNFMKTSCHLSGGLVFYEVCLCGAKVL